MIWSNELLEEVYTRIVNDGENYRSMAQILSEKFYPINIHQEQLRSALRRFIARKGKNEGTFINNTIEINKEDSFNRSFGNLSGQVFRFGAIGDTHLGSRYELLDVLNNIYNIYEREGITHVFHTGNHIDGEASFNKNDIYVHGMNNQVENFVNKYPRRKNITTYFITGADHEGWYHTREGVDIGWYTEQKANALQRHDLIYIGHIEADVQLTDRACMRVMHPGLGSSKAVSLAAQSIIDTFDDCDKPNIMLIGHYHKAHFLPNYRGVCAIQTGTTMGQSPWMRRQRIRADVGAWIATVAFNDEGYIDRLGAEYLTFNQGRWTHKM